MGFTPSIIASLGNDEERNNYEKTLRSRAMTLLSYNAPKTRMKALPIMYSANFGSGSDLHECMNIIANDKYNDADIVRTVLDEYCSETNGSLAIDDYKLNAKLDEAWNSANQKDKASSFLSDCVCFDDESSVLDGSFNTSLFSCMSIIEGTTGSLRVITLHGIGPFSPKSMNSFFSGL